MLEQPILCSDLFYALFFIEPKTIRDRLGFLRKQKDERPHLQVTASGSIEDIPLSLQDTQALAEQSFLEQTHIFQDPPGY